jgi:hypothetical protein
MINGFIFFFNNLNHSQPTSPNETLLPGVKAMRLAASPWVDMVSVSQTSTDFHVFPSLDGPRRSCTWELCAVCAMCAMCAVCLGSRWRPDGHFQERQLKATTCTQPCVWNPKGWPFHAVSKYVKLRINPKKTPEKKNSKFPTGTDLLGSASAGCNTPSHSWFPHEPGPDSCATMVGPDWRMVGLGQTMFIWLSMGVRLLVRCTAQGWVTLWKWDFRCGSNTNLGLIDPADPGDFLSRQDHLPLQAIGRISNWASDLFFPEGREGSRPGSQERRSHETLAARISQAPLEGRGYCRWCLTGGSCWFYSIFLYFGLYLYRSFLNIEEFQGTSVIRSP